MRVASLLFVGLLTVGASACQDDDVNRRLGARCTENDDCETKCLPPGASYPGGMCTSLCMGDGDCAGDAVCASREGGVCLFSCRVDADCGFLGEINGQAWLCRPDAASGDRTEMVCLGAGQ